MSIREIVLYFGNHLKRIDMNVILVCSVNNFHCL